MWLAKLGVASALYYKVSAIQRHSDQGQYDSTKDANASMGCDEYPPVEGHRRRRRDGDRFHVTLQARRYLRQPVVGNAGNQSTTIGNREEFRNVSMLLKHRPYARSVETAKGAPLPE